MSSPTGRWKLRSRLYVKQCGKCHWCNRLTRMSGQWPEGGVPEDLATVDHLNPRGSSRAHLHGKRGDTVLACYRCNSAHNELDQMSRAA